jgi:hypothetical protein
MSMAKLEQIRCPCGEIFEAELYNSINAAEDPDLKEALICGEINVVCCPHCSQIFYAEHFLLYNDPSGELIAFVYPSSFKADEKYWKSRMHEDFDKAVEAMPAGSKLAYDPIIMFGLDELVQLIKEEDEINDEISILEYSAKDTGVEVIKLKPALARAVKLPRCMPSERGHKKPDRNGIIEGLRKLVNFNPHLTWFTKLLDMVEKDHKWSISEKLLAKRPLHAAGHRKC